MSLQKQVIQSMLSDYYTTAIDYVPRFGLPIFFYIIGEVNVVLVRSISCTYGIATDKRGFRSILLRPSILFPFALNVEDYKALLTELNLKYIVTTYGIQFNPTD